MLVTRVIFVLALFGAAVLQGAPMCTIGSLASYIALGAGGCMDGDNLVKDFSFPAPVFGGGAVPVTAAAITVTPLPLSGPSTNGLKFSSPGWAVSGTGFVEYVIGYTWDPHNIRSMDDLLLDPVTPP